MTPLRKACATGYARMAARAALLDHINVFPVADADTGVNLRLSLAPLRDIHSDNNQCLAQLQQSATGNSGNIAAAFFVPLLKEEQPSNSRIEIDTLAAQLAQGSHLARQAVLAPQDGTMLDVFSALAAWHEAGRSRLSGPELLEQLAATVRATARILPELRQAGVVDAGALGLFFFFEGFFAQYLEDESLYRSPGERFQGLLEPALPVQNDEELGSCINVSIQQGAPQADPALLAELGESVVAREDSGTLHLHLHSHAPDQLREKLQQFGAISAWRSERMHSPPRQSQAEPGLLHLLCDAAGSLPRTLAQAEGITLLDSYVICAGEARPETLWEPSSIYKALRAGEKVSTAQASLFERQQHFSSALELYGPTLYLSVGSAYTGNYAAALAWQKQADTGKQFMVVDSGAASGRLACIALLSARANRRLASQQALLTEVNTLCRDAEEYVCIDSLRYLAAGGRISKMRELAGGLLGLKPIISPQQEGVRKMGVARSQNSQLDFVLERMERLGQKGTVPLALLQYTDNVDWVRTAVLPQLRQILPASEILVLPLSLTSGVHMGPGTWSVAACPQRMES